MLTAAGLLAFAGWRLPVCQSNLRLSFMPVCAFAFFSNRPFQNFFYHSIQLSETSLIEKWSMVVSEVRKGFQNSEHLIIDGAVHSDPLFLSSPKIKDVMLEFMKGQKISTTQITLEPLKFMPIVQPKTN